MADSIDSVHEGREEEAEELEKRERDGLIAEARVRSDNAVKNWWNGSMNRKKRGLSTPTTSRTYSGRRPSAFPFR
jgi:hypothetical protein